MKRSVRPGVGAILLMCAVLSPVIRAATETEKSTAIQKGLGYLHNTQQATGHWNAPGYERAATGAAAFALLSQQDKWGSNATAYQAAVDKAIAYLLSAAKITDVTTRNDGLNICPGGSASCKAVYWSDNVDSTYTTGLIAPAIAAYGLKVGASAVATNSGPLAGMTWGHIAQAITNAFAASQSTRGNGNRDGGWHGFPGNGDSDSATTHSAVISLLYDESLGATTPQAVKDELKVWLGNVQNASGAVCLQPGTEPCDHANTGGWLLAMRFVGYDLTNSQVQPALRFLNAHWQETANNVVYGNYGQPYAMWTIYGALDATIGLDDTTNITNLLTDCRSQNQTNDTSCTWSEDYNQWLIKNQKADGSWSGYAYWGDPLATALYINILGQIQIPSLPQNSVTRTVDQTSQTQSSAGLTSRLQTSIAAVPVVNAEVAHPAGNPSLVRPFVRRGVTSVAVNGDGTAIASASSDNTIRIWNPTTGVQNAVLQGLANLPTGVAFNPGGRTLSSVGRDSLVRVWDAVSGSELAELAGHEHAIRAVAVSPDGKFLASAGEESRIMLWDLAGRKLSQILFGSTDFVNAVAFSPDSRLLAAAGEDARILIFDVASGRILHTLLGHSGAINAIAFDPDGTILASGGQDSVIHLWDPANGVQRQVLAGHQGPIRAITFSPDGRLIASGGEDTQIILWNAAGGGINKVLLGSTGFIDALAFGTPGVFLVSASEAGDITLWNVMAGIRIRTLTLP